MFAGDLTIVLKTIKKGFAKEDVAVDTDSVEAFFDQERKEYWNE